MPKFDKLGYEKMVAKMKLAELQNPSTNGKLISQLMQHTFHQRREWILNEGIMTIQKIFNEFPALKHANHVSIIIVSLSINNYS